MRICKVRENRCRELGASGESLNKTAPTFVQGSPVTFQVNNPSLKSTVQGMT